MDNKKGFLQWLKQTFFITADEKSEKKSTKYQYVLFLLLIGVAFMLVSNFFSHGGKSQANMPVTTEVKQDQPVFGQNSDDKTKVIKQFETQYENELKDALESIVGVDDVTVVVNVDETAIDVLEKNVTTQNQTTDETDREGGKRNVGDQSRTEEVVIVRNGDQEKPVVITTKKPPIRGVLVVAKGAENIQIKQWIVEAVTRLLDVRSNHVSVLPKKTKGD